MNINEQEMAKNPWDYFQIIEKNIFTENDNYIFKKVDKSGLGNPIWGLIRKRDNLVIMKAGYGDRLNPPKAWISCWRNQLAA